MFIYPITYLPLYLSLNWFCLKLYDLLMQAAFIASHKAHASLSTKPIHEADVAEPVLCVVCQISCISKEAYANHIYGKRHRNNLELQPGNVLPRPDALPKEVLTRQNRRTRRRQRKVGE